MSRSLTRTLGVLALLAVPAALLLRSTGFGRPGSGAAAEPDAVPVEQFRAEPDSPRAPVRPKRAITPGVEVVVNIPSGRLELFAGDTLVQSYPVSVGSARYSTPVGDYLLATVIWNPWWHPPRESAWAANRKPTPPGPGNPMGRVKLHMDELIYIHGTSSEGRLGAPASHGCIRMANRDVVDLARRLNRLADPEISDAELGRLSAADRRTRETVMARSVRMRVTYKVAQVRGGKLHVYPDVYGRAGDFAAQVRRELDRSGNASVPVDPVAMRYLRSRARGGASFALADLGTLREPQPRVLLAEPVLAPEAPAVVGVPIPDPARTDSVAPAPAQADSAVTQR